MFESLRDTNKAVVATIALAMVMVLTLGSFFLFRASSASAQRMALEQVVDPYTTGNVNLTDEVTVVGSDPDSFSPATVRPSVAPPQIRASGDCREAMDAIRSDVFRPYRSGLVLDQKGSSLLTAELSVLDQRCTASLSSKFRAQELAPWLNYRVEPAS